MPERGIYFANGPITDVEFRYVIHSLNFEVKLEFQLFVPQLCSWQDCIAHCSCSLIFRLVLEYSKPVIDVLQSFDNFTENINEQSISTFPTRLREECTFKWQQKIHFAISEFNTVSRLTIHK